MICYSSKFALLFSLKNILTCLIYSYINILGANTDEISVFDKYKDTMRASVKWESQ